MTKKKTKQTKKTRFVPRMILGSAALVSVVPAVVALIDCGSDDTGSNGTDAGQYAVGQGVAVAAFFDAAGQEDTGEPDAPFAVAVAAFFDSGQDTGSDASDATTDGAESEGGHDSGTG